MDLHRGQYMIVPCVMLKNMIVPGMIDWGMSAIYQYDSSREDRLL